MNNCQKVPYDSKQEAREDAREIKNGHRHFSRTANRARKGGRKLRAYECNRCGKWHLTTWSRARFN